MLLDEVRLVVRLEWSLFKVLCWLGLAGTLRLTFPRLEP